MPEKLLAPARHETSDVGTPFIWIGVPLLFVSVLALALLVLWLFPKSTLDQAKQLTLPTFPESAIAAESPRNHGPLLRRGDATAERHGVGG